MDSNARKTFWDVLNQCRDSNPETCQKLCNSFKLPKYLYRFRSVSESSLSQLQDNKLFFSSADYYDDPFDTYFHINIKQLKPLYDNMKKQLSESTLQSQMVVEQLAQQTGIDAKKIFSGLESSELNFDQAALNLEAVRSMIRKSLFSICFCEDALNETLWLKYANNHKGFVIEYEINNPETIICGTQDKCNQCPAKTRPAIYPVYYAEERESKYDATRYAMALYLANNPQFLNNPIIMQVLQQNIAFEAERISLIKKKCHEHDQEWRMIRPFMHPERTYIMMKPSKVILGLHMPEYEKRLVTSAAQIAGVNQIYEVYIDDNDELNGRPRKEG